MSKLPNLIQRRELEPVLQKASKIAKHYEKATNCMAKVIKPESNDNNIGANQLCSVCQKCQRKNKKRTGTNCGILRANDADDSKIPGGSCSYICPQGLLFWINPFYSGKRLAGAFISGGKRKNEKTCRTMAHANMMLLCADRITKGSERSRAARQTLENAGIEDTFEIEYSDSSINSIDMERILLACLRRGDLTEAGKIMHKLLSIKYHEARGNFAVLRLKALELSVMLSRAIADPNDINDSEVVEMNSRYLKKISECSGYREIADTLVEFAQKISGKIFSFHGVRHFSALRKAERFIWENYTRKLSLQETAKVSGLSAPYFSTIFKEEMGENFSDYLNRLRVEKAAVLLVTTNLPISEIAKTCGFEDQSWFSKIYKNNTGLTPGKYREQGNFGPTAGGFTADGISA